MSSKNGRSELVSLLSYMKFVKEVKQSEEWEDSGSPLGCEMFHEEIRIRTASPDDAQEILDIYAPYVIKTAITFEYEVPTLEEFRKRIENTLKRYPYLVAEGKGALWGYAYTGAFHERAAYEHAAEVSIYVREDKKGCGIGKGLYTALEDISRAQHILNLNACIGYPEIEDEYLTKDSVRFHAHLGYSMVGEFHKCGYKFGRWYNMVWMEKMIGEHGNRPEPLIPFPSLGMGKKGEYCLWQGQ